MGRTPKHRQERRDVPSFGDYLRASRLGWAWSEAHGCFVRMADAGPDTFSIEVAPLGLLPAESAGALHRCWWEAEDKGAALLQACHVLRGVHRPEHYRRWLVDMDGREVQRPGGGR